jgi:primosomal replication protein N''
MSGPLKPFIDKIHAAVSRSRLLNLGGRGHQVDVASLAVVDANEPRELLDAVISRRRHALEFSLLPDWGAHSSADEPGEGESGVPTKPLSKTDRQKRHTQIYGHLDHLQRQSELVEKETGLRSLWLGYPVLHIRLMTAEDTAPKSRLAPLFLWPLRLHKDSKKHGGVHVESSSELGPAAYNAPLGQWLKKNFSVEMSWPDAGEMAELGLEHIEGTIRALAGAVKGTQVSDLGGLIEAIPSRDRLATMPSPAVLNAAVISMFRFPAESIARDLEALDKWLEQKSAAPSGSVKIYYPTTNGTAEPDDGQSDARSMDLFSKLVKGVKMDAPEVRIPGTERERQLVTDTDHSQQEAVWRARAWPGCVIQGPPGTGKSQTIVNIIADTLARGQTVLMVCQKSAATDVVHNRLRAAGLDGLCVHVHDPVKQRKGVFEAIREQVDALCQKTIPGDWESLAQQIDQDERTLEEYHRAVEARLEACGVSFRDAMKWRAEDRRTCPSSVNAHAVLEAVKTWTEQDLRARLPEIARIAQEYQTARVWENPWTGVAHGIIVEEMWSDHALKLIRCAGEAAGQVESATTPGITRLVPPSDGVLQEEIAALDVLRDAISSVDPCARAGVDEFERMCRTGDQGVSAAHSRVAQLGDAVALGTVATALAPDPHWHPLLKGLSEAARVTLLMSVTVLEPFVSKPTRVLFPSYRANLKHLRSIRPDASGKSLGSILATYRVHERWEKATRDFEAACERLRLAEGAGLETFPRLDMVRSAHSGATIAAQALEVVQCHQWLKPLLSAAVDGVQSRHAAAEWAGAERRRLEAIRTHFRPCVEALIAELGAAAGKELWSIAMRDGPVTSWLRRARDGVGTMSHLKAWIAESGDAASPLHSLLGLLGAPLADGSKGEEGLGRDLSPSELGRLWSARVRLALCEHWIKVFYEQHPIMQKVTPEGLTNIRSNLKTRLERKRQIESKRVEAIWSTPQDKTKGTPWKEVLKLKGGSKGPSHSLQKAVKIGSAEALLTLRPCWITNPDVACQLFPLHPGLFDLVIFDEASQCPPEYALPVIYRGSRVVIAGDEWQMPPTSFFASGVADSEDYGEDENGEATDASVEIEKIVAQSLREADSLLEGAEGKLPSAMLRVHYRSEHPELIAFSNHAFYKRLMIAPPPRPDREASFQPIVFDYAEDVYSKQINEAEARRVIRHLRRLLLEDETSPTIGVVTFNLKQRELIEAMLESEARSDSTLAARLEKERNRQDKQGLHVGLFIKNLENVQGDERDVMLFSTTFGRNAEGKFFKMFGPVGQQRGERRLNVAVTRAKRRVIVVTSMPVSEVSAALNAGAAAGLTPAGYLQLYLEYARHISNGSEGKQSSQQVLNIIDKQAGPPPTHGLPESPLEEEVVGYLDAQGHRVQSQIGEGGFRIDIGLRHADPARGFALGIECDGATFHSSALARIRDVWRQSILEGRGWRIHRVWSTEWWQQPANCKSKLGTAIQSALASR